MGAEPIPLQEAVRAMHKISATHGRADARTTQQSARLDDLVEALTQALEKDDEPVDQKANEALDELVRRLNAHSNLTWQFARWWDVQTGPVSSETNALLTRRWFDVMAAFRAAMEV